MAITKKLIHFKQFSNFNTQKLSANRENTSYKVGVSGAVISGEPYILYQSIVFIQDVLKIWTHGSLYDCGETDLSDYLTADEIAEVYATIEALNGKQDTISDLEAIRNGASKGATALQTVPDEYVTETELTGKGYATTSSMNTELAKKVDKVSGKGLSTNDFTTALKTKLEGLSNYDDTELSGAIESLRGDFDALVSGDTTTAIKTFNEVIAFLDGITDSEDLESIIASIEQQIAAKQDVIADLDAIRSGAALGATALQTVPSEYITETELTGKGYATTASVTAGLAGKQDTVSDLGTIRDNAAKGATAVQPESLADVATSGSYEDLSDKPTIPSEVTESTVSGWGFTKNTGTYSKPSGGIPKSDLASTVQTSLGKADTALQSHQDISGKLDSSVAASTYATKTEMAGKVNSDGNILNIVKVTTLPSSPDANTLYVIVES